MLHIYFYFEQWQSISQRMFNEFWVQIDCWRLYFYYGCNECRGGKWQCRKKHAEIFGAMPAIQDISLSPDGSKIGFLSPGPGKATDLYTIDLTKGGAPLRVTSSSGEREHLRWCGGFPMNGLPAKLRGRTSTQEGFTVFPAFLRLTQMAVHQNYWAKNRHEMP